MFLELLLELLSLSRLSAFVDLVKKVSSKQSKPPTKLAGQC